MSTNAPAQGASSSDIQTQQHANHAAVHSNSFSQQSQTSNDSQTAAEFIRDQELLEADAREALPYSIDSCTKILGPMRQNVFACLTCNPPPNTATHSWTPAGICYACSVQCHGSHALVELFHKRNFTCDCGTTRILSSRPCTLRINNETNTRGGVRFEEPDANNKYNQNFRNRFCGCECDYDPFMQEGTMFQCLGLGTTETGGCGQDWYHPGCLVGMGPRWFEKMETPKKALAIQGNGTLQSAAEDKEASPVRNEVADQIPAAADESAVADDYEYDEDDEDDEDEDPPMPPGFPDEDDFDGLLCYKCVESNPWIKAYAGTSGFLAPVKLNHTQPATEKLDQGASKKRKAEDDAENEDDAKRVKGDDAPSKEAAVAEESESVPVESDAKAPEAVSGEERPADCKLTRLAQRASPVPDEPFSLFFKEDFRDHLCRCSACYLKLDPHPQLLEDEVVYEPPLSNDGASQHGGSTHGSGSLLERGESALRNVDRVRAIEGVMAYNHLKDKLKPFFQQFAESGQAIGAEDIKAYFAKLRGDEEDIKQAGEAAAQDRGDDNRREQSGH